MRLGLIIGDSHAAALRLAARGFADDLPGVTFDFAAMHGEMTNFTIRKGALTARLKKDRDRLALLSGRESFDLGDYDFVAVCGGAPSNFHALRLYQKARFAALPSVAGSDLPRNPDWMLVSEACFATALAGLMRRTSAFALLAELEKAGVKRRFLIPMPLLSIAALGAGQRFQAFAELDAAGDALAMAALMDRAFAESCDTLATPVPWPQEVRHNHFFTRPEYRRGATRLAAKEDQPQPEDDFLHANADYGRAVLKALAGQL